MTESEKHGQGTSQDEYPDHPECPECENPGEAIREDHGNMQYGCPTCEHVWWFK